MRPTVLLLLLVGSLLLVASCQGAVSHNPPAAGTGPTSYTDPATDDIGEKDDANGSPTEDTGEWPDVDEPVDFSAKEIPVEECVGLYLAVNEDGECYYDCPENTVPDHSMRTCVCAPGACEAGFDTEFRIVCEYYSEEGSEPYIAGGAWSCSRGTKPSNCLVQCVCQEGMIITGEDQFGRRVCEPPSTEDCPLPYHKLDLATGDCLWNCAKGTEPNEESGECVCKEGFEPAPNNDWLDDLGRLICFKTPDAGCSCPVGSECLDGLCLDAFGPDPGYFLSDPPLMRGLHNDGGEGERFFMPFPLTIQAVKGALWAEGSGNITLSIYRARSGDEAWELLAEKTLSFDDLPFYYGIHSEIRPVFFTLDTPVEVATGDIVEAIFMTDHSSDEWEVGYAVSGIYMSSIFADGEMAFHNGAPGLGGNTDQGWDYLATLLGSK